MEENGVLEHNKSLQEINRYKDSAFPVGMYVVTKEQIIPHGRGYMDLHWHEELQLTYVTSGMLELQVNGTGYRLEKGEGILINRNFVHITTGLTDGGRYVSYNFPDRLLGFFPGSRMEREDVLPYTSQYAFPAMVFKPEVCWQREILESMEEMRGLFLQEIWGEDFGGSGGDGVRNLERRPEKGIRGGDLPGNPSGAGAAGRPAGEVQSGGAAYRDLVSGDFTSGGWGRRRVEGEYS